MGDEVQEPPSNKINHSVDLAVYSAKTALFLAKTHKMDTKYHADQSSQEERLGLTVLILIGTSTSTAQLPLVLSLPTNIIPHSPVR